MAQKVGDEAVGPLKFRAARSVSVSRSPMTRQICVDCSASPPDMGDGHTTLASASPSSGWRLSKTQEPDGTNSVVWRCPECWLAHRPPRIEIPRPSAWMALRRRSAPVLKWFGLRREP
jgi:hypothetical protein